MDCEEKNKIASFVARTLKLRNWKNFYVSRPSIRQTIEMQRKWIKNFSIVKSLSTIVYWRSYMCMWYLNVCPLIYVPFNGKQFVQHLIFCHMLLVSYQCYEPLFFNKKKGRKHLSDFYVHEMSRFCIKFYRFHSSGVPCEVRYRFAFSANKFVHIHLEVFTDCFESRNLYWPEKKYVSLYNTKV